MQTLSFSYPQVLRRTMAGKKFVYTGQIAQRPIDRASYQLAEKTEFKDKLRRKFALFQAPEQLLYVYFKSLGHHQRAGACRIRCRNNDIQCFCQSRHAGENSGSRSQHQAGR